MAALLKPFGICAEFLNSNVATEVFSLGLDKAIKYIQKLEEVDFKEKVITLVFLLIINICNYIFKKKNVINFPPPLDRFTF